MQNENSMYNVCIIKVLDLCKMKTSMYNADVSGII